MILSATAYESGRLAGQIFFMLLFVGGGVTLLVLGLAARRRSSAPAMPLAFPLPVPVGPGVGSGPATADVPATDAVSPPQPQWPDPALLVQPPKRQGTKRIVFGAILLALSVLSAAGQAVNSSDASGPTGASKTVTTVALPPTLLGLTRDDANITAMKAGLIADLGKTLDQVDVGLYGEPPKSMVVISGQGNIKVSDAEMRAFGSGVSASTGADIGEGVNVSPGPLGGMAHCWDAPLEGTKMIVCYFVNNASMVATYDHEAKSVEQGAARARAVRSAVVTRH